MVPFENILVALSSVEKDRGTVELAIRLAERSGGCLTIAHVPRPLPDGLLVDINSQFDVGETLT